MDLSRGFKQFLFILGLMVAYTPAQAEACRSLEVIMKDMRANFQYVSRNYQDYRTENEVIRGGQQLVALAQEASVCPPSGVDVRHYQEVMEDLIQNIRNFVNAVANRDTASAQLHLNRMDQIRREGHRLFD